MRAWDPEATVRLTFVPTWRTTWRASDRTGLPPACRPSGRTRTWRGSSSIRSWRRLPDIAVRTRRRARLTGALTLLVVSASTLRMARLQRRASRNNPYKDHISLRTIRSQRPRFAQLFIQYTALFRTIQSVARLCGTWPGQCNPRASSTPLLSPTAYKKAARVGMTQAARLVWTRWSVGCFRPRRRTTATHSASGGDRPSRTAPRSGWRA